MTNLLSPCYPFQQAPLPFAYNALEPEIDAETMELHYAHLFRSFVDSLNAILAEAPRLQCCSLEELLRCCNRLPPNLRTPIMRNAGGAYSHALYFEGLTPGGSPPCGTLARVLECTYGSLELFKAQFKARALEVFGSGYAWLAANRAGRVCILLSANQDTPLPQGCIPLLNIDMWEHAYFLKYQINSAAYVDAWLRTADFGRASVVYEERFC